MGVQSTIVTRPNTASGFRRLFQRDGWYRISESVEQCTYHDFGGEKRGQPRNPGLFRKRRRVT